MGKVCAHALLAFGQSGVWGGDKGARGPGVGVGETHVSLWCRTHSSNHSLETHASPGACPGQLPF